MPAPADLDLSLEWHLVVATPRCEHKAAEKLTEAGCTVFLPKLRKVSVTRHRRFEYEVATFPRYLFAAGVPNLARRMTIRGDDGKTGITIDGRPITDIRQIEGVSDVIRNSKGEWALVPPAAIALIAAYQNDVSIAARPRPFWPGQPVEVIDGPFMSFQAEVIDVIGRHEAEVLISIFGRATRTRVGLAQIRAA